MGTEDLFLLFSSGGRGLQEVSEVQSLVVKSPILTYQFIILYGHTNVTNIE